MTELAPSLVDLARRFGIATAYEDWTGRRVLVPAATLVAVLASLGVAAGTDVFRRDARRFERGGVGLTVVAHGIELGRHHYRRRQPG